MRLQLEDWAMETDDESLSVGRKRVVVSDASPETYATVRAAMVDAFEGKSLSPLLSGLATADVNPESGLRVSLSSVESDGALLADSVVATGTVGNAVPEGTRDLLTDSASLSEVAALGAANWSELRIERGDGTFVANDVTMELDGTTFAISSSGGTTEASGRSFEFSDMALNITPPETIPAPHVQFASKVRQLGSKGKLTLSAVKSAAADSGITVDNTLDAIRSARFDLSFAEVTEGGEAVVSDFQTSGTVAELLQTMRKKTGAKEEVEQEPEEEEEPEEDEELNKRAIVSSPDTDELLGYQFRVTGDLEYPERGEDAGGATETITDLGDEGVRVQGGVSTGDDQFLFSGELIEEDVSPEIEIEVTEE
jgi:hypothetical protein